MRLKMINKDKKMIGIYVKSLFVFLILISFSGCGASASGVKTDLDEKWINNPPADNAKYFYALGYGETQKDAKSDALSVISAKISVDVSSSFLSSVTATRHGDNEDVLRESKNDVLSKAKSIEYTDVKVVNSKKYVSEWVLLVSVDRDILTKSYERKLDKVDDKLKQEWQFFLGADIFEKLKLSVNINKYLKETDEYFALLYALKQNYDDSRYKSRYLDYTKEMRKAQNELVFKIVFDENSKSLASLIKTKLSAKNITFNYSKYNAKINITTKAKKRKYESSNDSFKNLTFALRLTTIKVSNKNGEELSNTVYKTKDGSKHGFKDAIQKTAKYEKMLAKKGIIRFLTGN